MGVTLVKRRCLYKVIRIELMSYWILILLLNSRGEAELKQL